MRRAFLFIRLGRSRFYVAFAILCIIFLQSCKDDSYLTIPPPLPDASFTESFDNYDEAYAKGWRSVNNSEPIGRKWYDVAETPNFGSPNYVVIYYPGWNQAQFTLDSLQFPYAPFPQRYWMNAYASQIASNGYVATSIACADAINQYQVSCWLISPEQLIKNGDTIVFYTYCKSLARLQVCVNVSNTLNTGIDPNLTGDFNITLLDINPTYARVENEPSLAYPTEWTRFETRVAGLEKPVKGRFAFRYLLPRRRAIQFSTTDPNNLDTLYKQIHSTVIGIDEVTYTSSK